MSALFCHRNILVRFFSLYLLGLLCFYITWTISYFFLPEAVLRNTGFLAKLAGNEAAGHPVLEWLKIFGLNLIPCLIVVVANLYVIGRTFPLGYLIPLEWMIHYAILLGTNSFSIPMDHPLPPSLAVFGRSGLYEIAAYTWIAVATYAISRYRFRSFFSRPEPIEQKSRSLTLFDKLGILAALLILLLANLREAWMIAGPPS